MICVIPIRRKPGKGWGECEPHRAQMWAIATKRGNLVVKLHSCFGSKAEANEFLSLHERNKLGPARQYKLGSRMGKKPAGVGTVVKGRNPRYA